VKFRELRKKITEDIFPTKNVRGPVLEDFSGSIQEKFSLKMRNYLIIPIFRKEENPGVQKLRMTSVK